VKSSGVVWPVPATFRMTWPKTTMMAFDVSVRLFTVIVQGAMLVQVAAPSVSVVLPLTETSPTDAPFRRV